MYGETVESKGTTYRVCGDAVEYLALEWDGNRWYFGGRALPRSHKIFAQYKARAFMGGNNETYALVLGVLYEDGSGFATEFHRDGEMKTIVI